MVGPRYYEVAFGGATINVARDTRLTHLLYHLMMMIFTEHLKMTDQTTHNSLLSERIAPFVFDYGRDLRV